jgi:hypothetical protein
MIVDVPRHLHRTALYPLHLTAHLIFVLAISLKHFCWTTVSSSLHVTYKLLYHELHDGFLELLLAVIQRRLSSVQF